MCTIESSLNLIQEDLKCVIFVAVEMENQITTTNFFLSWQMSVRTFFLPLFILDFVEWQHLEHFPRTEETFLK